MVFPHFPDRNWWALWVCTLEQIHLKVYYIQLMHQYKSNAQPDSFFIRQMRSWVLHLWWMWDLWVGYRAAIMTNKQPALFQATAFDSLYNPTATLCAEVVSRSFQITPVPIKVTSSNLMHPRTEEGDINKLSWRVNIKLLSGWEGVEGKENIFSPLNGAINNHFPAERWSHKADGGFVV